MEEKDIVKIRRLLSLLDPQEALTKEEFVSSFETVVKMVQQMKADNSAEMQKMQDDMTAMCEQMKEDNELDVGNAKMQMNNAVCDYCDAMDAKMKEMVDTVESKMAEVKDGENPDVQECVNAVLAQLPPAKELEPETPETLRDKLEELQGEERLDKSAIRGLKEEIENLKSMIGNIKTGTGGGFKKLKWIAEIPSGTVDGNNATFYLSTIPDPDNLMLVLNGMAQRNGSTFEYTLAKKTITYNSAPPAGSQHFCWFSK